MLEDPARLRILRRADLGDDLRKRPGVRVRHRVRARTRRPQPATGGSPGSPVERSATGAGEWLRCAEVAAPRPVPGLQAIAATGFASFTGAIGFSSIQKLSREEKLRGEKPRFSPLTSP